MRVLFVTGAGTDVGKTHVAALLTRGLRAAGRNVMAVKPVASGVGPWSEPAFAASDTARLLAAQGLPLTRETVAACTPWRFLAALAPDMAARREGRSLSLGELLGFHAHILATTPAQDLVLVEGVGGLMSPVAEDATCLDWIKAIDCSVLLVGGSYLGAISHTLTALETLGRHGREAAVVAVSESQDSSVELEETVAAIAARTAAPVIPLRRCPLQALASASDALTSLTRDQAWLVASVREDGAAGQD